MTRFSTKAAMPVDTTLASGGESMSASGFDPGAWMLSQDGRLDA